MCFGKLSLYLHCVLTVDTVCVYMVHYVRIIVYLAQENSMDNDRTADERVRKAMRLSAQSFTHLERIQGITGISSATSVVELALAIYAMELSTKAKAAGFKAPKPEPEPEQNVPTYTLGTLYAMAEGRPIPYDPTVAGAAQVVDTPKTGTVADTDMLDDESEIPF